VLADGAIGAPFRARIEMVSGFPVFDNQPYLKDLEQFILADMGVHILDYARVLFGEAESVYCQTSRVHRDIKGEDVATVMMKMGAARPFCVTWAMPVTTWSASGSRRHSSSSRGSEDRWSWPPITGSASRRRPAPIPMRYPPPHYAWADAAYDVAHSSLVACNANLLQALRGEGPAETTGEDNLKTLRLVFAGYDSAQRGEAVRLETSG